MKDKINLIILAIITVTLIASATAIHISNNDTWYFPKSTVKANKRTGQVLIYNMDTNEWIERK